MKKVLYTLVILASLAASLSSCQEEVIKPKDDAGTGSGSGTKGS